MAGSTISQRGYNGQWVVILSNEDKQLGFQTAKRNGREHPIDNRGAVLTNEESDQYWCLGICGEIAVARAGNLLWSGSIEEDVPPYQVKTVRKPHHRLFIPENGKHQEPEQIYISVLANHDLSFFCIRGWMTVKQIKEYPLEDLNNSERNSCWVVPNNELNPMTDLKEFK